MGQARTALRFALFGAMLFASACDASFTDLRDPADKDPLVTNTSTNAPQGGERVVARGNWEGRAGHAGSGTAELVEFDGGALELRLLDDFSTSGVPGPVVILSTREGLGRRLDSNEDLELGRLERSSGAQKYSIPILDDGRRVAWVFCKPFGVEVARAVMAEVQ